MTIKEPYSLYTQGILCVCSEVFGVECGTAQKKWFFGVSLGYVVLFLSCSVHKEEWPKKKKKLSSSRADSHSSDSEASPFVKDALILNCLFPPPPLNFAMQKCWEKRKIGWCQTLQTKAKNVRVVWGREFLNVGNLLPLPPHFWMFYVVSNPDICTG